MYGVLARFKLSRNECVLVYGSYMLREQSGKSRIYTHCPSEIALILTIWPCKKQMLHCCPNFVVRKQPRKDSSALQAQGPCIYRTTWPETTPCLVCPGSKRPKPEHAAPGARQSGTVARIQSKSGIPSARWLPRHSRVRRWYGPKCLEPSYFPTWSNTWRHRWFGFLRSVAGHSISLAPGLERPVA
jgi:hypothetical protein